MNMNEPLIWTSKGNVPLSSLTHKPHWENHPESIVFVDEYFDGDESIKRSVHVLSKHGVTGESIINDVGG